LMLIENKKAPWQPTCLDLASSSFGPGSPKRRDPVPLQDHNPPLATEEEAPSKVQQLIILLIQGWKWWEQTIWRRGEGRNLQNVRNAFIHIIAAIYQRLLHQHWVLSGFKRKYIARMIKIISHTLQPVLAKTVASKSPISLYARATPSSMSL
jgi:hypothetical protein